MVILEEDISELDEVHVVAYGQTNKREMTGAISVVKAESIKGIPSPSIANLLQGRVAGMDVTNITVAVEPKSPFAGTTPSAWKVDDDSLIPYGLLTGFPWPLSPPR